MQKKLLTKIKNLSKNDSFLVTITTFDQKKKGKELDTFLFISRFPYEEFDGTKKTIAKLIENELKKQKV